jgi:Predicted 3'-5' exonuclease related to the exonuclease domain of PolB
MPNLFIDIETTPDHARLHLFDLPQPPETLPAPADLLAEAIPSIESFLNEFAACLALDYLEQLTGHETAGKARAGVFKCLKSAREALARQRTELSVTPEYCRVVALGWAEGDSDPEAEVVGLPRIVEADGLVDERLLLVEFWHLVEYRKPTVIGFNILDFDLRVLLVRSALLGVQPTRLFDLKPWGRDCIDLMKLRFPAGKAMGLKKLARLYGLPVPVDDVDGSMIADLIETEPERVAGYVKSDIEVTRQLYRFYAGYFC